MVEEPDPTRMFRSLDEAWTHDNRGAFQQSHTAMGI